MAAMTPFVLTPVPQLAGMTPAVAEVHLGGVGVAGSPSHPVVSDPGSANTNLAGGVGPAVAKLASGEGTKATSGNFNPQEAEQKPPAVTSTHKRRRLPWCSNHDSAPTVAELSSGVTDIDEATQAMQEPTSASPIAAL